MFEQFLLNLLLKELDFVEGLNADSLRYSIWSGEVVLRNLTLSVKKLNARLLKNSDDFPLVIRAAYCGEIKFMIPWTSLGSSPLNISARDLFILVGPRQPEPWTEAEEAAASAAKRAEKRLHLSRAIQLRNSISGESAHQNRDDFVWRSGDGRDGGETTSSNKVADSDAARTASFASVSFDAAAAAAASSATLAAATATAAVTAVGDFALGRSGHAAAATTTSATSPPPPPSSASQQQPASNPPGMMERLVTKIIDNLQISIERVHIRLENDSSWLADNEDDPDEIEAQEDEDDTSGRGAASGTSQGHLFGDEEFTDSELDLFFLDSDTASGLSTVTTQESSSIEHDSVSLSMQSSASSSGSTSAVTKNTTSGSSDHGSSSGKETDRLRRRQYQEDHPRYRKDTDERRSGSLMNDRKRRQRARRRAHLARCSAFGLLLERASGDTVDASGLQAFVSAGPNGVVRKLCQIEGAQFYCRHRTLSVSKIASRSVVRFAQLMQLALDRPLRFSTAPSVMLSPTQASLHLQLNKSNVPDLEQPKLSVALNVDSLALSVSDRQLRAALALAKEFEQWPIRYKYRRFRPISSDPLSDPRAWWHFALTAVRHDVRVQLGSDRWNLSAGFLRRRRQLREAYIELYLQHRRLEAQRDSKEPLSPSSTLKQTSMRLEVCSASLLNMEDLLSVEDILFYRALADAGLDLEKEKETLSDAELASHGSSQSSSSSSIPLNSELESDAQLPIHDTSTSQSSGKSTFSSSPLSAAVSSSTSVSAAAAAAAATAASSAPSGWISWLWGDSDDPVISLAQGNSPPSAIGASSKDLSAAGQGSPATAEEAKAVLRRKLLETIDYDADVEAARSSISSFPGPVSSASSSSRRRDDLGSTQPPLYVDTRIQSSIGQVQLRVCRGSRALLTAMATDGQFSYEQRPFSSSTLVKASLGSAAVSDDLNSDSRFPLILQPSAMAMVGGREQRASGSIEHCLFEFELELNPPAFSLQHGSCSGDNEISENINAIRVFARLQPLDVVLVPQLVTSVVTTFLHPFSSPSSSIISQENTSSSNLKDPGKRMDSGRRIMERRRSESGGGRRRARKVLNFDEDLSKTGEQDTIVGLKPKEKRKSRRSNPSNGNDKQSPPPLTSFPWRLLLNVEAAAPRISIPADLKVLGAPLLEVDLGHFSIRTEKKKEPRKKSARKKSAARVALDIHIADFKQLSVSVVYGNKQRQPQPQRHQPQPYSTPSQQRHNEFIQQASVRSPSFGVQISDASPNLNSAASSSYAKRFTVVHPFAVRLVIHCLVQDNVRSAERASSQIPPALSIHLSLPSVQVRLYLNQLRRIVRVLEACMPHFEEVSTKLNDAEGDSVRVRETVERKNPESRGTEQSSTTRSRFFGGLLQSMPFNDVELTASLGSARIIWRGESSTTIYVSLMIDKLSLSLRLNEELVHAFCSLTAIELVDLSSGDLKAPNLIVWPGDAMTGGSELLRIRYSLHIAERSHSVAITLDALQLKLSRELMEGVILFADQLQSLFSALAPSASEDRLRKATNNDDNEDEFALAGAEQQSLMLSSGESKELISIKFDAKGLTLAIGWEGQPLAKVSLRHSGCHARVMMRLTASCESENDSAFNVSYRLVSADGFLGQLAVVDVVSQSEEEGKDSGGNKVDDFHARRTKGKRKRAAASLPQNRHSMILQTASSAGGGSHTLDFWFIDEPAMTLCRDAALWSRPRAGPAPRSSSSSLTRLSEIRRLRVRIGAIRFAYVQRFVFELYSCLADVVAVRSLVAGGGDVLSRGAADYIASFHAPPSISTATSKDHSVAAAEQQRLEKLHRRDQSQRAKVERKSKSTHQSKSSTSSSNSSQYPHSRGINPHDDAHGVLPWLQIAVDVDTPTILFPWQATKLDAIEINLGKMSLRNERIYEPLDRRKIHQSQKSVPDSEAVVGERMEILVSEVNMQTIHSLRHKSSSSEKSSRVSTERCDLLAPFSARFCATTRHREKSSDRNVASTSNSDASGCTGDTFQRKTSVHTAGDDGNSRSSSSSSSSSAAATRSASASSSSFSSFSPGSARSTMNYRLQITPLIASVDENQLELLSDVLLDNVDLPWLVALATDDEAGESDTVGKQSTVNEHSLGDNEQLSEVETDMSGTSGDRSLRVAVEFGIPDVRLRLFKGTAPQRRWQDAFASIRSSGLLFKMRAHWSPNGVMDFLDVQGSIASLVLRDDRPNALVPEQKRVLLRCTRHPSTDAMFAGARRNFSEHRVSSPASSPQPDHSHAAGPATPITGVVGGEPRVDSISASFQPQPKPIRPTVGVTASSPSAIDFRRPTSPLQRPQSAPLLDSPSRSSFKSVDLFPTSPSKEDDAAESSSNAYVHSSSDFRSASSIFDVNQMNEPISIHLKQGTKTARKTSANDLLSLIIRLHAPTIVAVPDAYESLAVYIVPKLYMLVQRFSASIDVDAEAEHVVGSGVQGEPRRDTPAEKMPLDRDFFASDDDEMSHSFDEDDNESNSGEGLASSLTTPRTVSSTRFLPVPGSIRGGHSIALAAAGLSLRAPVSPGASILSSPNKGSKKRSQTNRSASSTSAHSSASSSRRASLELVDYNTSVTESMHSSSHDEKILGKGGQIRGDSDSMAASTDSKSTKALGDAREEDDKSEDTASASRTKPSIVQPWLRAELVVQRLLVIFIPSTVSTTSSSALSARADSWMTLHLANDESQSWSLQGGLHHFSLSRTPLLTAKEVSLLRSPKKPLALKKVNENRSLSESIVKPFSGMIEVRSGSRIIGNHAEGTGNDEAAESEADSPEDEGEHNSGQQDSQQQESVNSRVKVRLGTIRITLASADFAILLASARDSLNSVARISAVLKEHSDRNQMQSVHHVGQRQQHRQHHDRHHIDSIDPRLGNRIESTHEGRAPGADVWSLELRSSELRITLISDMARRNVPVLDVRAEKTNFRMLNEMIVCAQGIDSAMTAERESTEPSVFAPNTAQNTIQCHALTVHCTSMLHIDAFNNRISCWEPVIEPWSLSIDLRQSPLVGLRLDVSSGKLLALNLSMSFLDSLSSRKSSTSSTISSRFSSPVSSSSSK